MIFWQTGVRQVEPAAKAAADLTVDSRPIA